MFTTLSHKARLAADNLPSLDANKIHVLGVDKRTFHDPEMLLVLGRGNVCTRILDSTTFVR